MKVAIIGGGIAGLTAALCLKHVGQEPVIFERAEAFGDVGAGLQLGPNAVKVLHALGLEKNLIHIADVPGRLTLSSGYSGQEIASLPLADAARERWGAPYLHCHRADLVRLLADAVAQSGIACHFSAEIVRLDGKTLVTKGGAKHASDAIVLASGIRSALPGLELDLPSPRFTGSIAWRAIVPALAFGRFMPSQDAAIWAGRGRHAVTYPLRGGSIVNLVGVVDTKENAAETWAQTGSQADALSDFRGFHPTVLKALRGVEILHKWGIYERALPARWHAEQAAVIGDACHAMPPYLAQGAAMAIEDAWALAQCLAQSSAPAEAFAAFQNMRAPRVQRVIDAAQANKQRFHMSSLSKRLGAFGMLKAVNKVAQRQMLQQVDWLYGYDVTV